MPDVAPAPPALRTAPPPLLLVRSSWGREESIAALAALVAIDAASAIRVVVTDAKLDTQKAAKNFNIHAGHSPILPRLMTLSHRAGRAVASDPAFRAGFDLWALREIVARDGGDAGWAVLVLGEGFAPGALPGPRKRKSRAVWAGDAFLAVDLQHPDARAILDMALAMIEDGAAYRDEATRASLLESAAEALAVIAENGDAAGAGPVDTAPGGPSEAELEALAEAEAEGNDIDADTAQEDE